MRNILPLWTVTALTLLGVAFCASDPANIHALPAQKFYQFSNQQALQETQKILSGLRTAAAAQDQSPELSKAHKRDLQLEEGNSQKEIAAEPEQVADAREKLFQLRQQLAFDESVRNVPAALEGYLKMHQQLKEVLTRRPHTSSDPGANETASPEEASKVEKITSIDSLEDADPILEPLGAAAFDLAVMTLTGLAGGVRPRNESLGVQMLKDAALAGSIAAHLALSNRYLQGLGIERDCDLAFQHGKQAAFHFIEQAELAGAFQPPVEPVLLRERWRNADFLMPLPGALSQTTEGSLFGPAVAAEPTAPVNLFELLHRDEMGDDFGAWQWLQGVPAATPREEPFLQVLQQMAAEGDEEALFNLGYLHLKGINVEKNATAAFFLFTAAMLKKSAAAYNALGVMYHNGNDVPADYTAARRMFEAAANLGDVDSMFNLGTLYMAGHGVPKAPEIALQHFQNANDNQHWQAPFQLSLMYHKGEGTPQNCIEATRHLNTFLVERAPWHDDIHSAVTVLDEGDEWKGLVLMAFVAEQGSTAGQHNLAFALETSKTFHLPERFQLAYEMYLRSGGAGYFAPGLTDAANLVWNGHKFHLASGTNRSRALELFQEASQQGDTEATFYLAWVHEGRGAVVSRNATKAAELYWKAIRMAPSERFAAAPYLALLLLRLQGYQRLSARLFGGLRARKGLPWDLAVLSALASGLATVLYLRWQRRQRAARRPSLAM